MTESVEKSVLVPLNPSEAFHLFFGGMGQWWPRAYTWGGDAMQAVGVEPRLGGLCFELGPHGFRCDWGRILEWDAPHRARLAWQIGPGREPVPDPGKASVVEVRFAPQGAGATRVTVEHAGFERHGAGADEYRAAMASGHGWPYLLDQFAAAVRLRQRKGPGHRAASHKPAGHDAVSPYLLVASVADALAFLKSTFEATELYKQALPDGTVKHAEVRIDDSVVMLGERPDGREPVRCSTHVYVPDVDAAYRRALAAGATPISEPKDQPYGDRSCGVRDADGNIWWIGTHLQA